MKDTEKMLELVIVAIFAGVFSLLLIDFFTKKKTEINGAHVVVSFKTVSANFEENFRNGPY